jgi:hypothetical protein
MASDSDNQLHTGDQTPCPYRRGQSLRIQILQNFTDPPITYEAEAIVCKVFSMTMSPVMAVTTIEGTGHSRRSRRAVLKLYDRRFGSHFRDVRYEYKPHTSSDEAAFQSFIHSGKIEPFLHELKVQEREADDPPRPHHFLEDDDPDGVARFEAALWQQSQEYFTTETLAYSRLSSLQGKAIPKMYAHIRLISEFGKTESGSDQSRIASYLDIKGILLEEVRGYSLWDLPITSLAPAEHTWPGIVQSAVDAAFIINGHGVLMHDCDPRNVVVDQKSQLPFIIDLAQCDFKDQTLEEWEETGYRNDEDDYGNVDKDWTPEAGWWKFMSQTDNCGAIGAVMTTRLQRTKNLSLAVKYPDYDKVIRDLQQKKCTGVQGSE